MTLVRAALALSLGALALASGCGDRTEPRTVSPPPSVTSPSAPATSEPTTPPTSSAAATLGPVSPGAPWPAVRIVKAWTGFDEPLYLTSAPRPDGSGPEDLYVVEKPGRIWRIRDGRTEKTPVLDLTGAVSTGSEQGLLGLAFPPGTSDHFYVYYTDVPGDTVVARYEMDARGRAVAGSARTILTVDQPYANHNGGNLVFGPDGMLYIGLGDGGSGGDPQDRAQDLGELLGKILRIDVEATPPAGRTYAIPRDNPFVRRRGARPEVWDYGLRNPWRFSFSPLTGYLYIADVGQNAWEEVDAERIGRGGVNYGWNLWEGDHPYPPGSDPPRAGFTFPVAEFPQPEWRSITGGYAYDGTAIPALRGVYVFGDFGNGQVWGLRRATTGWQTRQLLDTELSISSFGLAGGELYVIDLGGDVYRFVGR